MACLGVTEVLLNTGRRSITGDATQRCNGLPDPHIVFPGDGGLQRAQILFQILDILGPRDGEEVRALG